jgi:uroporphyrinogen III methyltransferase/synthase
MGKLGIRGKRILLPRALQAREVLPEALREMGAEVEVVPAYKSVRPIRDLDRVRAYLKEKKISVVTFTSSSTVNHFVEMFDPQELISLMAGVVVASIGPITAKTVQRAGLTNHIMPDQYTIAALAKAIADYFKRS